MLPVEARYASSLLAPPAGPISANGQLLRLFRQRLRHEWDLRLSPRTQTPQALCRLECTQFSGLLVPPARFLDIRLQTDDLHLGKLIGIVGACERHGALCQTAFDGTLEELAGRNNVAALELLDTLGMQPEDSLALRRRLRQRSRTGTIGPECLAERRRLWRRRRYAEHHAGLRQDVAFDADQGDCDARLALQTGWQNDAQCRQRDERYGPGPGCNRIPVREGRRWRQTSNSDEAVLGDRIRRTNLNWQTRPGRRLGAQYRSDRNGWLLLRVCKPVPALASQNCPGGSGNDHAPGNETLRPRRACNSCNPHGRRNGAFVGPTLWSASQHSTPGMAPQRPVIRPLKAASAVCSIPETD